MSLGFLKSVFAAFSRNKEQSESLKQDELSVDQVSFETLEALEQIVSPVLLNGQFVRFSIPDHAGAYCSDVQGYRTPEAFDLLWSNVNPGGMHIIKSLDGKREDLEKLVIPYGGASMVIVGTPRMEKGCSNCYDLDFIMVPYQGEVVTNQVIERSGQRIHRSITGLSQQQVEGAIQDYIEQSKSCSFECRRVDTEVIVLDPEPIDLPTAHKKISL